MTMTMSGDLRDCGDSNDDGGSLRDEVRAALKCTLGANETRVALM